MNDYDSAKRIFSQSVYHTIGHIIEDSKALIASITGAIFIHVRRQANRTAHQLARYALLSNLFVCPWDRPRA
ncbi:unnamed protein product [Malus baccata var. baccata]